MPKLLVVDKSIFHCLYLCDEKLRAFVKDYNVVLPHALAIECLISENQTPDKDPVKLLEGFDGAIKAGAKMGYSSTKLFQAEKMTLCPAKSVVDESTTKLFRNSIPNTNADFIKQEAKCCQKSFEPIIKSVLGIAKTLYDNLCKREELSKELHKEKDRKRRFEKWIQNMDGSMKDILKNLFSEEISCGADANWFTWQMARLYFAYSLDWMFKKSLPGSSEKKDISNDFYDIEYVTYLSRADGLLTNDGKLQVPLATAAFPKKDVFVVGTKVQSEVFDNIINIIPQSYRKGFRMVKYYKEFSMLKSFSLDITKEVCGKIAEAVLHIEETNSGNKHELLLKNPKVPSAPPSTTIRDLFDNLTTKSVESFKVFGEQHNTDVLWRIEIWDNSGITGNTIHCRGIEGLPKVE